MTFPMAKPRKCVRCLDVREIHAFDMCRLCYNRDRVDARRAERRRSYWKNLEATRAKNRAYYHANKAACRAQQNAKRARDREALTSHGKALTQVRGWGFAG
jgi:hypothetical protein